MTPKTLTKGTLLFRGVDCAPKNVGNPLRLNCSEGLLWTVTRSLVAQTYIPEFGCTYHFRIPWAGECWEHITPGNPLIDTLVRKLGGGVEILRREWDLLENYKKHAQPGQSLEDWAKDIPIITAGTYGRPMSWKTQPGKKEITWPDIIAELKRLGYPADHDTVVELKTSTVNGEDVVFPAKARLKGSLIIYRLTDDLTGDNHSCGESNSLDPDYHRAAAYNAWALAEGRDFILIDDFCQTQGWGNVDHHSIAINENGLAKLAVEAVLPAYHREWPVTNPFLETVPTPEERAWRRGLLKNAAETATFTPNSPQIS